jgi:hypothetical protein
VRPLTILFTNHTLNERAGSELWVRDVARALVQRGHRPIAFSLVTGPVAIELREATVPVVSDLASLSQPPDLIHGHHHVETLIAALHFPGAPIVHFCHGWVPWEERPLKHPAIVRYVAVDRTCADRLVCEEGIPAEDVDLLLNFVDLDRFRPRDPLPARPRRALVFGNQAREEGYAAVIREACRADGIEVRLAGSASGRVLERPETALPEFEVVFAKGRAALEALAVGCSVILADPRGAGPLVTPVDCDRFRALNFGVRLLQERHGVGWYRAQLARYDAADAARVSARVRDEAGLDAAVDRLLDIYEHALAEHAARTQHGEIGNALESGHAAARHLAWMAAHLKTAHDVTLRAERLAADLTSAHALNQALAAERDGLAGDVDRRAAALESVADRRDAASAGRDAAIVERDVAISARDTAIAERDAAAAQRDAAVRQRDEASAAHQAAIARHDAAAALREAALTEAVAAETAASRELRRERDAIAARYESLPSMRLRNLCLRVPLVGALARRSARWIAARAARQEEGG